MATVIAFHAHPDDEVILTGGTLARAVAEGDRVLIVVATQGMDPNGPTPRQGELQASAAALGVERVIRLGYADSGHGPLLYPDPPGWTRFARADTEAAAERLAAILRAERAEVLIGYDPNGGYGHRDHLKVHEVGRRAAELVGVPTVLEATAPRDLAVRVGRVLRALRVPFRFDLEGTFSPSAAITHRVDVRRYARQKRAALLAYRSVVHGKGRLAPALRLLLRLPLPVFALFAGREWFVDPARTPVPYERRRTEDLIGRTWV
ncbi:PIG-L family deacetylase [Actinokineospora auranticolor]|uniref:LmbE family N-acetylglucosaminyl deacetylase n=1 Tax=Actinokineospora auranticolor TaxID=155976 RepID=A0A2S6GI01_9PSEU|nr:PIG-L family deacetylase [Actinokineospora auranticolor]PPK64849.1 LmbE family N-acetylglucosaminyl deacetylase [Actinokineospora auranticolor]